MKTAKWLLTLRILFAIVIPMHAYADNGVGVNYVITPTTIGGYDSNGNVDSKLTQELERMNPRFNVNISPTRRASTNKPVVCFDLTRTDRSSSGNICFGASARYDTTNKYTYQLCNSSELGTLRSISLSMPNSDGYIKTTIQVPEKFDDEGLIYFHFYDKNGNLQKFIGMFISQYDAKRLFSDVAKAVTQYGFRKTSDSATIDLNF